VTATPVDQPALHRRSWRLGAQRLFIVVCCAVAWIPASIPVAGLKLRASQIILPAILLLLWAERPRPTLSRFELVLLASGALWWGITVAFTLLFNPDVKALARCLLLLLNMLHAVAIYALVVRTGRHDDAGSVFTSAVAWLGVYLLLVSFLMSIGVPLPTSWVLENQEPITQDGEIVGATVNRFTAGVLTGCIAAGALALVLSQLLRGGHTQRRALLFRGAMAGVGVILGFSRQGLVSVAAGLMTVGGLVLATGGRMRRVARALIVTATIAAMVVYGVQFVPGARDLYAAFAARAQLLFEPDAYTTGTVLGRTVMWTSMLEDVSQQPLLGRGQDAYLQYMERDEEGSHNFPLEVLHTTGVGGFAAYLIFHLAAPIVALGIIRRRARRRQVPYDLIGVLAAFVAIGLASLTNLIFWNPVYWIVGGLLAATVTVMLNEDRRAEVAARAAIAHREASAAS
jgi:hypothetical protein